MSSTIITVEEYTEDGKIAVIRFTDGKKYRLQHPGNRTYLEWQKEFFSVTDGLDQTKFLDKAFEYCVIPEGHEFRPNIDNIKPKELGAWSKVLRRFCDGDLDTPVERSQQTPVRKGNKTPDNE